MNRALKAIPKDARVELQNPKTAYREKMTQLRKTFAQEHIIRTKKIEEQEKLQREELESKSRAIDQDIQEFKQQQQPGNLSGRTTKEDPIFRSRRKMWAEFVKERQQRRYQHYVSTMNEQSSRRVNNLLYLYHAASNFITVENMESKIAAALENPTGSLHMKSYDGLKMTVDSGKFTGAVANEREAMVKDILMGTSSHGKTGLSDIRSWLNEQK